MNSRLRQSPPLVPVFLQQRPEGLIAILTIAAPSTAQNAFLNRAEFAKRAVDPAAVQRCTRLESTPADHAEHERADETRRFEEHPGPARRRVDRAFPFGVLERQIELPHLHQADDRT